MRETWRLPLPKRKTATQGSLMMASHLPTVLQRSTFDNSTDASGDQHVRAVDWGVLDELCHECWGLLLDHERSEIWNFVVECARRSITLSVGHDSQAP